MIEFFTHPIWDTIIVVGMFVLVLTAIIIETLISKRWKQKHKPTDYHIHGCFK